MAAKQPQHKLFKWQTKSAWKRLWEPSTEYARLMLFFMFSAVRTSRGEGKRKRSASVFLWQLVTVLLVSIFLCTCVLLVWWIITTKRSSGLPMTARRTQRNAVDRMQDEVCGVLIITRLRCFSPDVHLSATKTWCAITCQSATNQIKNMDCLFSLSHILSVCYQSLSMTERMCVCVYLFISRWCADSWKKLLPLTAGTISLLRRDEMCEMHGVMQSHAYTLGTWKC